MARARAVTIGDVARTAHVSPATVSRVLNGAVTVDRTLAERVMEAVRHTGYVTNPVGRALRRQVSETWTVIVPDLENPFFTGVIVALERAGIELGFSVMICNTHEDLERERRYIATAVAQRVAGVVIAVASQSTSDLSPLHDAGVPTVVIDRRVRDFPGDAVFVDNELAGGLVARHMVQRGCRRPACISGPVDVSAVEDRLTGFRDALEAAGLDLPDHRIRRHELDPHGGENALSSLLASDEPPDAVYVTNGPFTAGCYFAAQERRVRMPHDLVFVGTDDERWTRMVRPRVTVVRQPIGEIGACAARLLARRSGESSWDDGEVHTLPPELMVRESG